MPRLVPGPEREGWRPEASARRGTRWGGAPPPPRLARSLSISSLTFSTTLWPSTTDSYGGGGGSSGGGDARAPPNAASVATAGAPLAASMVANCSGSSGAGSMVARRSARDAALHGSSPPSTLCMPSARAAARRLLRACRRLPAGPCRDKATANARSALRAPAGRTPADAGDAALVVEWLAQGLPSVRESGLDGGLAWARRRAQRFAGAAAGARAAVLGPGRPAHAVPSHGAGWRRRRPPPGQRPTTLAPPQPTLDALLAHFPPKRPRP